MTKQINLMMSESNNKIPINGDKPTPTTLRGRPKNSTGL